MSIPPLFDPSYNNTVLAHTTENEFYIVFLRKWVKYNEIWVVESYETYSREALDDIMEFNDGILTVGLHSKDEAKKEPNLHSIEISEAPESVQNWANQLMSYDD